MPEIDVLHSNLTDTTALCMGSPRFWTKCHCDWHEDRRVHAIFLILVAIILDEEHGGDSSYKQQDVTMRETALCWLKTKYCGING